MEPVRTHRGFTLIELLVVIAIIALLVSILLPSLSKAKDLARRAVCLANTHHIGLGVQLYAQENDGWGMGAYRGDAHQLMYNGGPPVYLGTLMDAGVLDIPPDMLFCPASQFAPGWTKNTWANSSTPKYGWEHRSGYPFCSYTTNPNLSSYTSGDPTNDAYKDTRGRLSELRSSLAIVSDWHGWLSTNSKYGPCPRNHGIDYYNVLRVDGSAGAFQDTDHLMYDMVENNFSTGRRFDLIPN